MNSIAWRRHVNAPSGCLLRRVAVPLTARRLHANAYPLVDRRPRSVESASAPPPKVFHLPTQLWYEEHFWRNEPRGRWPRSDAPATGASRG